MLISIDSMESYSSASLSPNIWFTNSVFIDVNIWWKQPVRLLYLPFCLLHMHVLNILQFLKRHLASVFRLLAFCTNGLMVSKGRTRCGRAGRERCCVTYALWWKHCVCVCSFLLLSFILVMKLLQIPSLTKLYLNCNLMNHAEVFSFFFFLYFFYVYSIHYYTHYSVWFLVYILESTEYWCLTCAINS